MLVDVFIYINIIHVDHIVFIHSRCISSANYIACLMHIYFKVGLRMLLFTEHWWSSTATRSAHYAFHMIQKVSNFRHQIDLYADASSTCSHISVLWKVLKGWRSVDWCDKVQTRRFDQQPTSNNHWTVKIITIWWLFN